MGIKIVKSHSLYFSIFCFAVFIFIHPCSASTTNVTKLVDEVCAKTSNYTFCVESLYSDPHAAAAAADAYRLANITFALAYVNATSTQNHIREVLLNGTSCPSRRRLQRCGNDYKNGVSAIEMAINDLNSKAFDLLANYADFAARGAMDCQSAFEGSHSPLTFMNNALKGLCEICVVISDLINNPHI